MRIDLSSTRTLCAAAALSISGLAAHALGPPPGALVVNQATITFKDANGKAGSATTNEVFLTVQQVFAGRLLSDRSVDVAPDGTARFFHTLTNIGNGEDAFCVSAANLTGDDGQYGTIHVVLDANENGLRDPSESLVYSSSANAVGLLTLAADETASLIVEGITPAGLSPDDTLRLEIVAQSREGGATCVAGTVDDGVTADDQNTDIARISDDAILRIIKTSTYVENGAGTADDQIIYTLTVENEGVADASDVRIRDTLPAGTGSGAVTASTGTFTAGPGFVGAEMQADMAALVSGDTASVEFTVAVDDGLDPDTEIVNTATVQGNLDGVAGLETAVESNTVRDSVGAVYGVSIEDTGTGQNAAANDGGDDDNTLNDVQQVDRIEPGGIVVFTHPVTNLGNGTDSFNVTVAAGTFPPGTAFQLFRPDGVTPALDTNGDGIPDTGPLDPNESVALVMKASLPIEATGGPFDATLTAISTSSTTAIDTTTARLLLVLGSGVDIANADTAAGFGDDGTLDAHPAATVTTTLGGDRGGTVVFPLYAANEGTGPDGYQLSASASADGTVALPSGWSVGFFAPDGTAISQVPELAAGASYAFEARVGIPPDAPTGTQSLFFAVASASTGVRDSKQDAVTVGVIRAITLTPSQSGTIAPCGTLDYRHNLTNTGTDAEVVGLSVAGGTLDHTLQYPTSTAAGEPSGFVTDGALSVGSTVFVFDASTGLLSGVALVSDGAGGLAVPVDPGDRLVVELRIIAPCSTAEALIDAATLTATTLDGTIVVSNEDITTVTRAMLRIVKRGALDAGCDGTPDTPFVVTTQGAGPRECVIWQLDVRNAGARPVCNVDVKDRAPAFTTLHGLPVIVAQPLPGEGTCSVNAPDIACAVGNARDITGDSTPEPACLMPGEAGEVRFSVRIE